MRFSQAGGRISQCLAAEHRLKKVVNRLGQLRADKFCPPRRESPKSKDFPRRGGLYAEVARRFTPSKKVVNRLDQPRAQKSQAFHHTERPGFFYLIFTS